jgi:trans-aconitate 2-methyltransferase
MIVAIRKLIAHSHHRRADTMNKPATTREWDAAAYHRVSAPQVSWGRKILEQLSLQGDETVMDAGCGTGRLTRELLELVPRGKVVAVDISRNMLQTAREHLQPEFGDRVEFLACDLVDLSFDRRFDGIFSTASFHWITDHDRLFRVLFRALKAGGWLCAQCGGGPNIKRLLDRVSVMADTPKYRPYIGGYDPWFYDYPESAAERLRKAGFVDVETDLHDAPTQFATAEEFKEFVAKVILRQHLDRIPEESLRNNLLDELTRQAAQDSPPFLLDYWRLNLKGRRPR